MQVLIATGLYPPEIGGPATYTRLLEDELPKQGITVTTVPFGWVRHYPKIIRHIVYGYKVWQEARRSHADIVYALDPISVGIPALCVARILHKPFIIRLGGDYAWEQGRVRYGLTETLDTFITGTTYRPFMVRVLAKIQSYVTASAVRVVAPSQYLKKIITTWGVPAEKIEVIYSALYPLAVSGTKEELKKQLEFSTPTLISAGRLVPWKGFSVLIDVVSELVARYPNITLVIIGDGPDEQSLKQQVIQQGLEAHVRFVGRVSKETLGASIKASDVFVLNTAYEGLSHQLIEVMDLGTPIVTTTVGGNTELITDSVHGFLVPFNDKTALSESIIRVLDHPETRVRIVQSARGRSKEFFQTEMIGHITTLLKSTHESHTS
jgi:glycosyltransferase involved in cell wall biosynthesis